MTTPAPTPGGVNNPYQVAFNKAYIASKPPQFAPFYDGSLQTPAARWALFAQLLGEGFGPLDEEIEGGGVDGYSCMYMRSVVYGQKWNPAGQGAVTSNQVLTPGMYSGDMPPGNIKVSILISDYPPYVAPSVAPAVPVAVTPIANPVGVLRIPSSINLLTQVGGLFTTNVDSSGQDGYPEMALWPAQGVGSAQGLTGQWQKIPGFFAAGSYWQKIQ